MNNPRIGPARRSLGRICKARVRVLPGDAAAHGRACAQTERDLRFSDFPRFLVELMLLKLVHLDNTVTLSALLESLGGAPPVTATASAAATSPVQSGQPLDKKKTEQQPPP